MQSCKPSDGRATRTRRIDQMTAPNCFAGLQSDRRDGRVFTLDIHHFIFDVFDPQGASFAAHSLQQSVAIEPSLAALSIYPIDELVWIEPRELRLKLLDIEQRNIRVIFPLSDEVSLECCSAGSIAK